MRNRWRPVGEPTDGRIKGASFALTTSISASANIYTRRESTWPRGALFYGVYTRPSERTPILHGSDVETRRHFTSLYGDSAADGRVIIVEKSFSVFVPFMVKHDRLSSA